MPTDESPQPKRTRIDLDITAHMAWSHPPHDAADMSFREQLEARLQLFIVMRKAQIEEYVTQEFGTWLVQEGQTDSWEC